MTITKNGNVGIGTATPGYKLEVSGTIKADDFECDGCINRANLTPELRKEFDDLNAKAKELDELKARLERLEDQRILN